jgi:hypothetical protein
MEAHEQHQQALIDAFAEIVRAESQKSTAKVALEEAEARYAAELRVVENILSSAWEKIEKLLAETGEPSVVLPGAVTDFEIYRTTPRESVKVVDPSAVPDAFCKTERKPKLKEIGDYLRAQARAELPLPNWAAVEPGESKWTWRACKKGKQNAESEAS